MDVRAITPLVWEHINPYGRYDLDMESRLAICALPCLRAALVPKWPAGTPDYHSLQLGRLWIGSSEARRKSLKRL
jgi:hypothetical protein